MSVPWVCFLCLQTASPGFVEFLSWLSPPHQSLPQTHLVGMGKVLHLEGTSKALLPILVWVDFPALLPDHGPVGTPLPPSLATRLRAQALSFEVSAGFVLSHPAGLEASSPILSVEPFLTCRTRSSLL